MKHLKRIVWAMVAIAAASMFAAGIAPATTLEIDGVTRNEPVTITADLLSGTSVTIKDTFGVTVNKCASSHMQPVTENPSTAATVTASFENAEPFQFTSCEEQVVTHNPGKLHIAHIPGTTKGTLSSSAAEWTTGTLFGTFTCKTEGGKHIGTLTGTGGNAILDIKARMTCGGFSLVWEGTYIVTTPLGLAVSA